MNGERLRADRLLVERGLFESRARAQAAIRAGLVRADGCVIARVSDCLDTTARIEAAAAHPYVSRGGLKLAAALDTFGIEPEGRTCLDVGASTGGFTDVLLRAGANRVYAVDVGRAQLHASLRTHERVANLEGRDIRTLDPTIFATRPTLAVVDVSFIGLRLVIPPVLALLADHAVLVALIKPQFEVGRPAVGRGGIVKDAAAQDAVCAAIRTEWEGHGLTVLGLIPSPIDGGDGNREFLIGAERRTETVIGAASTA